MNLIIEKSVITLLSLMVCFSIGIPIMMSGLMFLQGNEETIEVEAMISQIDQVVKYLEANPTESVVTMIYIPTNCVLEEQATGLQVTYLVDGAQKTRTIYSGMPIVVDGIDERGQLSFSAHVSMSTIKIELSPYEN